MQRQVIHNNRLTKKQITSELIDSTKEAPVNTATNVAPRHTRVFIVFLSILFIHACVTQESMLLPASGFPIEGILEGDRVSVITTDNRVHEFVVERVTSNGLEGKTKILAYTDMLSVEKVRKPATWPKTLGYVAVVGLLILALSHEEEDTGWCLFCPKNTED